MFATGKAIRAAIALVAGFTTFDAALAQVPSALLRAGEPLPGLSDPDTLIVSFDNAAVNHAGGFAVLVTTEDMKELRRCHAWGSATGSNPTLIRSTGQFGDLIQAEWEFYLGIDDAGSIVYSAILDTGLDSVWVDDLPILVEEDEIPSLPMQFSTFCSRPGVTGDGQPWFIGGISETQGGTKENRVLFLGTDLTPILEGGDFIPPIGLAIAPGPAISLDTRFSALGTNYITQVKVATGSIVNDDVVVINGQAAMLGGNFVREDELVPPLFGGLDSERFDNFDFVSITENGEWFLTGDTTRVTTGDEFVLVNGAIVLREGDVLSRGGLDYTLSGFIKGGYMNEDGDWAVTWDVNTPEPNPVNVEALILNGSLVLLEGDPVDWDGDGNPDADVTLSSFSGIKLQGSRVVLSDRADGLNLYFTAVVEMPGKMKMDPPTFTEGLFSIGPPNVTITEIRTDQVAPDPDTEEYFELQATAGTSLDGITYLVIGDGAGGAGTIEAAIDLTGSVVPFDGHFLAVEDDNTIAAPAERDRIFPAAGNALNFEDDDSVTHLIAFGFTGAIDDDLDVDDNGMLDVTPWITVLDAVGLIDPFSFEPVYGASLGFEDIGPDGGSAPGHVFRCTPEGEWRFGDIDETAGIDTPGLANGSCFVSCPEGLVLNEIRIDQCDADSDEYIELRGVGGASLDNACIVLIGDNPFEPGSCGVIQDVIELDGQTLTPSGRFLIASDDDTFGAEPDMVRFLSLENNEHLTFKLVCGCTNVNPFDDLDTDDDGMLDVEPWQEELDSIAIVGIDPEGDCTYGVAIGPALDESVPEHIFRCAPAGLIWQTGYLDPVIDDDTPGTPNSACDTPCFADLSGNDNVDFADILDVLAAWGSCPGCSCPEDLNNNGNVDFADILELIAAWGACPEG